ncbi:MAG: GNAT family N-acetyltransferase [Anaerolineae bacterium]|nr:GNAT family N-acetyltransferase [Anaerolineae bacterium]
MTFTIRPATAADADSIAAINNQIWPDLPTDSTRVADALTTRDHGCMVAADGQTVVGFLDSFATPNATVRGGRFRWELDLMAVALEARGHGLAAQMIAASNQLGWRLSCAYGHAVVRVGNIGAERAFAANGYTPSAPHLLMVADPTSGQPIISPPLGWLTVKTLTYIGLWIEPPYENPEAARITAHANGSESVGLLIPETENLRIEELSQIGFQPVNAYCRWTRKLG